MSSDVKEIPTKRVHECSDGKYRNDEQYQQHKLKEAQFKKDPDQFIHVDDIVLGAINIGENKYGLMFGKYPIFMMKQVVFDFMQKSFSMLQEMEYSQMLKQKKEGIVTAPGAGSIIT